MSYAIFGTHNQNSLNGALSYNKLQTVFFLTQTFASPFLEHLLQETSSCQFSLSALLRYKSCTTQECFFLKDLEPSLGNITIKKIEPLSSSLFGKIGA